MAGMSVWADMSTWMMATLALVPPFAIAAINAARGGLSQRVVALQLATSLAVMMLTLLTFALDQSSFIDLPLALAMRSLPGTLLAVLCLERWL